MRPRRCYFPLAIYIVCLTAPLSSGSKEAADLAVIVNKANPVSSLSSSELHKLFLGETQYWRSNQPVFLIVPDNASPEHETILRQIYGMSDSRYRQYWNGKLFRGEAVSPPTEMEPGGLTTEAVGAISGAIAIVERHDFPASVKVVRLDGSLPGEKGYPLHQP